MYGSHALSDVESRYSQTEREALAVVWACEHFDIYVRGSSFMVVTDHKPLVHIWSKPRPPLRIARWSLRLQPYDLTIVFRSGKDNPADYMSRHPATEDVRSSREEKIAEEYVEFISQTSVLNAITLEEVRAATANDKVLQTVIELCNTGRWDEVNKYNIDQATLRQFQNVRDELTVNRHGKLLLRNTRIIMPTSLQARAVQLAHESHQGTSKIKALIRSKVWFPGLDTAVDDAVRCCIRCQANTTRQHTEPLNMSNLPQFLRAYHCTPHTTTGFTPYRLLFGHDPGMKMPDAESFTHLDDSNVHERDAEAKGIMKCYADKHLHAEANPIDVGDTVLVKQPRLNKLSTPFNHW